MSTKTTEVEKDAPLTVFGFCGTVTIPTEQGAYQATAVGGVVESRPTGNPFILFSLKYLWDATGAPLEFQEPIRIRLNTMQAVTESIGFKFPEPEPEAKIEPEVQPEPKIESVVESSELESFFGKSDDGRADAEFFDDDKYFRDELDEEELVDDEEELVDDEEELVDDEEVSELPY